MLSLKLVDIWKRYSGRWVLEKVDLEVAASEIVCIYGENGVGKTTLLKIIAGLIAPTKGRVLIDGNVDRRFRNGLQGVLLHENILYEELTVEENISYYSKLYGNTDKELVDRLVKALGLEKYWRMRVGSLSYGWKKRANIVRAFLNNPKILLLDEPFTGLDINAYRNFIDIIKSVKKDRIILFTISNWEDLNRIHKDFEGDIDVMELREGKLHELKS